MPRLLAALLLTLSLPAFAATTRPSTVVNGLVDQIAAVIEPDASAKPRTFLATVRVTKIEGVGKEIEKILLAATAEIAIQAPDKAGLVVRHNGQTYAACRDGQELWAHVPDKKFGVVGKPGVPRFAADPKSLDTTVLPPFQLPIGVTQAKLSLLLASMEYVGEEKLGGETCDVVSVTPPEKIASLLSLPRSKVELAVRRADRLPARVRYDDGTIKAELLIENPRRVDAWPAENWKVHPNPGDTVETTAVGHLVKFLETARKIVEQKIPTLPPATGARRVHAYSGTGRLEIHDSTRVLFLAGSPEEMGRQQGELLPAECRDLTEKVLYGVGVGSSFAKGKWFFGEIESAVARLSPFISDRTFREVDAMATAVGVHKQEARLANFFPELFHCTGFALVGDATAGGAMYHGRVLDYLKGVGLEQNAVVTVYKPDVGHAWVNCGYAGFVGTVTAMNEKHISVGEMGGRGEGKWDGKPMAQLLREVMENAATLDQAVEIMRKGPRTCEYYYVIADGNAKQAVGIASTPDTFEVVKLGEAHARLPHAIKDAV
ncbi:MAG TPA: C45 family peptidase, partial [Tepidisphaeraceae bacterium]|nr:C45 family peptidase [Tepidisphaeraceae bacterium]